MEFSRIGKHTIKCIITEQEILDLGFSLDDIMSNGTRTQEFMNHIFDLAEQRFQTKFELGIKTVRADFMSDHTLALTFSEQTGANGMVDHLKDIVNSLIEGILPKDKTQESFVPEKEESIENFKMPEGVKIEVMFLFDDLDTVTRFAGLVSVNPIPKNALYKFEGTYFLQMDLTNSSEEDVKRLSMLTDEYASDIVVGADKRAFIEEHGDAIMKQEAIEKLKLL